MNYRANASVQQSQVIIIFAIFRNLRARICEVIVCPRRAKALAAATEIVEKRRERCDQRLWNA